MGPFVTDDVSLGHRDIGTTLRALPLARRTVLATTSPLEWLDQATPSPPSPA